MKERRKKMSPQGKNREEIVSKIKSRFIILTPKGEEFAFDKKFYVKDIPILDKYPSLEKLLRIEVSQKDISLTKEPPSIKIMRALELVDYEPASDPGHFRFYPKGMLIYNLLKDWAEEIAIDRFGAVEIGTPLVYDWSKPDIKEQGESFHERHYMVQSPNKKKELVLRFAGDFGLFRMMKGVKMSSKQLPLRIYEFSPSFRYEKSGELVGLRRLRAFSMPDIHCFCENLSQGWQEYQYLYNNYTDLANAIGVEYAVAFRIVDKFYQQYKENIVKLLKYTQKPALIEILSAMKHYWVVKHEFQFIDSVNGNCQLSTVQLDIEDAKRYGITFINKSGAKEGCIICHSSIGSLERWTYSILEEALKKETPFLPLWLSPVQARVIPVSEKFVDFAEKIAKEMNSKNIRADFDDRNETLGKKIRNAEMEWLPYLVVVGEREAQNKVLSVRIREPREQRQMSLGELINEIHTKTKGMPFRSLASSVRCTAQPIFVGGRR